MQATLFSIGMGIVAILLLIFSSVTAAVAAVAAWIALMRHFAQTHADRQRRITESFSKAVEQLGSDKLEVRLGGIYSLERISNESPADYWTVMETLTAFVRERSQRNERERTAVSLEERISKRAYFLWEENDRPQGADFRQKAEEMEKLGERPATDIDAVLTVIKRRSGRNGERERTSNWRLDLRGALLRRAALWGAHLEGAFLNRTHLEDAFLEGAYLEGAILWEAHLEGAFLETAHLEGAILWGAHLKGAFLRGVYLEGAHLVRAHLEGADLTYAIGLSQAQLTEAHGDAATQLPEGLDRPAHWTAPNEADKA